jgi:hypothetical protein
MVIASLTNELIASGEYLILQLDRGEFRPDAAFWLYNSEAGVWKLVIAGGRVSKYGSKDVYRAIQKVLKSQRPHLHGLELDDISISRSNSELVKLLRSAIRTGWKIAGIRFTSNVVNGTLIDDAYIYRLV